VHGHMTVFAFIQHTYADWMCFTFCQCKLKREKKNPTYLPLLKGCLFLSQSEVAKEHV
jgi:hypothetical protein